ncbi:hypothetical protein FKM82_019108 [Ascaphus truei]
MPVTSGSEGVSGIARHCRASHDTEWINILLLVHFHAAVKGLHGHSRGYTPRGWCCPRDRFQGDRADNKRRPAAWRRPGQQRNRGSRAGVRRGRR